MGGSPSSERFIVLVLFVVVTVLVLSEIHPNTTKAVAGSRPGLRRPPTTTHEEVDPSLEHDHDDDHRSSKVPVLVANAAEVNGAAAAVSASSNRTDGRCCRRPTPRPGHALACVLPGRVHTASRRHRLTLQLPATSVLPYTTAAPISSDRDCGGGGGRGPGPRRQGCLLHHFVHRKLTGEPTPAPGPAAVRGRRRRFGAPLRRSGRSGALGHRFRFRRHALAHRRRSSGGPRPRRHGRSAVLLARRFGVVAVVSGRPASFLVEQLAPAVGGRPVDGGVGTSGSAHSLRLVGLYGLEWAERDGAVIRRPEAEQWRSAVDGAVRRLRSAAPPGVVVERKGLAVTVHWRQAPERRPGRRCCRVRIGEKRAEGPPRPDVDRAPAGAGRRQGIGHPRPGRGARPRATWVTTSAIFPPSPPWPTWLPGPVWQRSRWRWSMPRVTPRWSPPPISPCPVRMRRWRSWSGWPWLSGTAAPALWPTGQRAASSWSFSQSTGRGTG